MFGGLVVVVTGAGLAIALAIQPERTQEEEMRDAIKHTVDSFDRCKPGQWSVAIETDAGRSRQRWVDAANAAMTTGHVDAMGCDAVILFLQLRGPCTRRDLVEFDNVIHDKMIGAGFTTLACGASEPRLELR